MENIPSFFDPIAGDGAFQTVFFLADSGAGEKDLPRLPALLAHHLRKMGLTGVDQNTEFARSQRDGMEILAHEFQLEGRFWFLALMRKGTRTLLCSYNGDTTPDGELAWILGQMVQSVQISD